MRNKSQSSYNLGVSLINSQDDYKNTQSIHCLYYSVLQMMKYRLSVARVDPISYEEQDRKFNGSSSHDWLLEEIRLRFSKRKTMLDFTEYFRSLKSKRIEADYTTRLFTSEEAAEYSQKVDNLLAKLRNI